ncbi:MAG TPA: NHL repeat-containing protein [Solimonas sp.]|nr:NHL repeat-containing protein [Solimonas sp.]
MPAISPARCLRPVLPILLTALLAGCSGGGGGDDDSAELIEAFGLYGQALFTDSAPNRGKSTAANTLAQPLGNVASDGTRLFIADTSNNRVLAFSAIPSSPDTAASFVLGQANATANTPATAQNRLALPAAVFLGEGKLVVTDSGNNRVLIWNSVPAAATPPDVVVGQADFASATSGTSAGMLAFPTSAVIANGRLVVADQNNNRVLVWNTVPTANGAVADLVLGQPDFATREADDEADEMNKPAGLWSDGFRLLVTDSGNNRVLYWALFPQQSSADADYVIGQSGFSRSSAGSSAATLRAPFGVGSDGTRIYIADSGNNRVLRYNAFPLENGLSAAAVYGQEELTAVIANDDDQDGEADDTPTARTLSGASGAAIHGGVLYVSDRNNNRILFFPQ